jgi:hypothetical protein
LGVSPVSIAVFFLIIIERLHQRPAQVLFLIEHAQALARAVFHLGRIGAEKRRACRRLFPSAIVKFIDR